MNLDLALLMAGAMTGLLVGLTGVGGGALMTPVLLLIFGIAPTTAIGTDLWFAAITKLGAARVHSARGLIDREVVLRLWVGSLPGALLTLWVMHALAGSATSGDFLRGAIAVAVILAGVGIAFQRRLQALGRRWRLRSSARFKAIQGPLTMATGAALGVLVALTSVGAGALGAIALAYLYPLRLTPPRLIATDIAHAIPLALVAGVGHLFVGNFDGWLLANLLAGSLPTVVLGAALSARLPHQFLRALLSVVLVMVGGKVLLA